MVEKSISSSAAVVKERIFGRFGWIEIVVSFRKQRRSGEQTNRGSFMKCIACLYSGVSWIGENESGDDGGGGARGKRGTTVENMIAWSSAVPINFWSIRGGRQGRPGPSILTSKHSLKGAMKIPVDDKLRQSDRVLAVNWSSRSSPFPPRLSSSEWTRRSRLIGAPGRSFGYSTVCWDRLKSISRPFYSMRKENERSLATVSANGVEC